jgi:ParB-like chromosome segregation protein Spo0J
MLRLRSLDTQMQVMAKHIEHWALGRLVPNARNPRTHSDAQVAQIAGSILAFGFTSSILVDAKAGIIAGHGRYLAALKLGLKTAPVIVLAAGRNRRMHSSGRVRSGRIQHNRPTPRRKAGDHGD